MANDRSLTELERDVEQARARLAADIARLRAPETLEGARRSVMDAAFGYRDQAMGKAKESARSFLDDVKARASANPGAAAAILAGVAWRLYRHPPVASALIGAGVAMLARTNAHDDRYAPGRLARVLAHEASERARRVKERAAAQIAELKESALGGPEEADQDAAPAPAARVGRAGRAAVIERAVADPREAAQRRDAYLLGFAALALGAAVGVARRRRAENVT
jgi:hypothetical protein